MLISYPDWVKLVAVKERGGATLLLGQLGIFSKVFEDLLADKDDAIRSIPIEKYLVQCLQTRCLFISAAKNVEDVKHKRDARN